MAISHADLSQKTQWRWRSELGSQFALLFVFLSVIAGLVAFVLCLAAEASRSEATWFALSEEGNGRKSSVCVYDSSGRTPLGCAVTAFLLMAVAMLAEHAYLLVAVDSSSKHPFYASWPQSQPPPPPSAIPHDPHTPATAAVAATTITRQACCLFLTAWICFAVAEVLLLIGIGVEAGHISNWRKPKPECHVTRPGLFAAAGIFGLISVLLGVGVYLTALQMQRLQQQQQAHAAGPRLQFPLPAPNAPAVTQSQQHGEKTSTSA
ncbi:uncharacterized protein LOC122055675 [Zingiber officinale]|uniref:uncharacterized protein LOC122055675 n=1 Tax=Zingiber officinale TaxID=94328 RepID=UPI001C4AAA32|nr:uncharacterized protein LOC122055675 [Zingiber officinale]